MHGNGIITHQQIQNYHNSTMQSLYVQELLHIKTHQNRNAKQGVSRPKQESLIIGI